MPEQERADIAIIGAGAAGLMAAIWAGRSAGRGPSPASGGGTRIVLLDGARRIGSKILVAGGGRCNVTHDMVDESAFAGSSSNAIRKVLRRFDVPQTVEFFRDVGVELKREKTGKLFPTTDDARTVLHALLRAADAAHVELRHPWRVAAIQFANGEFEVISADGRTIVSQRVILATGGKSLPKTGSDGAGFDLARSLGHSITPRVFPGLVPMTLARESPLCQLSGISAITTLEVRGGTGRRLARFTDSTLCTHFGLSGPGPLDVSRYLIDAHFHDPDAGLFINWLPEQNAETLDRALVDVSRGGDAISVGRFLRERGLASRLAETLCGMACIDASLSIARLTREERRRLVTTVVDQRLPVIGDRGFAHAEVTAGGVPLSELRLETMESRMCRGLHIIGEMCDVDGRIGGYNFQWAWASGYVAGTAAATMLRS